MQQFRKNLGKVSLTAEGVWDIESKYGVLSIVYDENTQHGFISKQPVPIGIDLYNSEYWMPLNVSGYADSNIIILNKKTSDASIESYTLEEAVKSIASVGRKPGCILGFYNSNVNRLDIGGRWEIWQFNSTTISEWEDLSNWQNIYYNYNQFVGWYRNEEQLKINNPYPEVGCYAYVGNILNEAVVYRCEIKHKWTETIQHAWDYVKIMIDGTVTVGENGNWYNNGEDTGIPANTKGDPGLSPFIRYNTSTNKLEYSYDKVKWIECSDYISTWFRLNNNKLEISRDNAKWNPVSDYIAAWFRWQATAGDTQANNVGRIQMSRDNGKTWTNMSNDFTNNLHIKKYIGVNESLPTSGIAEGTIYAKGPYYAEDDTLNDNPIYRMWVYAWKGNTLAWQDNGEFTSIAAGIVQETGDSEITIMSQKATTEAINEKPQIFLFSGSNNYINLITNQSSLKLELPNAITGVFGNSIESIPGDVYDVEISAFSYASNCFLVYNRTNTNFAVRVGRILKDDYIIAAIRNNDTITSDTTNLDIQTYKSYCLDVALNGEFKSDRYMAKDLIGRNADFEATAIRIAATAMTVVIDNVNYVRYGINGIKKIEAGNYPINISYCDKQKTDYVLCINTSANDADKQDIFYLIPNAYYSSQDLPESFFIICILTTDEPLTTSSTSMNVVTINKDILVNRKLLSYAQQGIDINNEELRNSNKYIRRISGKYSYILAHFGGGGMLEDHPISYRDGNARYLPEYSITNVMLAKQMGFDGVGLNVHSTSDGVLVCCHDDTINRTFRNKTDYSRILSDVAIASNTYAQLAENYVCETQIERLRGAILKLEDVIITCKNINLGIAIIPNGSIITSVANLMQKYDFSDWMFIGNWRPDGSGNVMYITPANKTADEIIADLNIIGKPASCLFETIALQSYTDAQILEIAEACHKAGYGVAIDCYGSKEEIQKFRNWGCFDITSVDNEIPSFENGNYISLSSVADFSEFSCSNEGTIVTGVLPASATISYYKQEETKDLVAATLKIQFEGTIRLTFGQGYTNQEVDVDFSSDGSKEEVFTNIFFDEQVGFTITALGSVDIKNIKFDAKK